MSNEINKHRMARVAAVQCLYAYQLGKGTPNDIVLSYLDFHAEEHNELKMNIDYFRNLFFHTTSRIHEIDQYLSKYSSRSLNLLDPIILAILRYATYEIIADTKAAPALIINEAIDIAKIMGGEGANRFVNSILDKVSKDVRSSLSIEQETNDISI